MSFHHGRLYLVVGPTFPELKFPVLNIHGYVNKITRSVHDINRGKLQWCFDAHGTIANHDAPFDNT